MGTFPPCWLKRKYSEVPETFLESVVFDQQCALDTSLSLSLYKNQFDFGFIYLTLNQTKIDYFAYKNLLLKEKEPENSKLQSYWNNCNFSLIPLMTKEKHPAITARARKQNWKKGETKINFGSFIPLQMTKLQKSLNIPITNALCWLRYNQWEVLFRSVTTLDDLRLAINSERNFSCLRSMFLRGQNYANFC